MGPQAAVPQRAGEEDGGKEIGAAMLQCPKPAKAGPPSYFFNCGSCQRPILVEPNQAGSKLDCLCGAPHVVPSLINLKPVSALPAHEESPFTPSRHAGGPSQHQPGQRVQATCPFCSRPMEYGRIIGNTYQLKWLGAAAPLMMGIWALGGSPLGHGGFPTFLRAYVAGWRCAPCGKIIVDERG
jgi:hypothetical protein